MQCPACERDLKEMEAGSITVDACVGGCGGIWFDVLELQEVDEAHEKDGEKLLDIEVVEIRGFCPIYRLGDRILVDDPQIVLDKTDALCTHALSSLLHYTLVLEKGADPVKLGLTKPEDADNAYIQCVDPGKPYTDGGTVVFRVHKVKEKENSR